MYYGTDFNDQFRQAAIYVDRILRGGKPATQPIKFRLVINLKAARDLGLEVLMGLGLISIFLLAIVKFVLIDAVGHLPIIAILFVLIVRGPTQGRYFLVLEQKSLWTEAYFMTGLYFLAFVLVFIAYYGFHFLAYGIS